MSFGNVLTRLYDAFSRCLQFCSYKYNDTAVWYLQFCSYTKIYRKKGNKHDKEYSLLKHDRFCLLYICLCSSLKPNSVLQSILLIVLSHWKKELLFDEIPSNTPTEKNLERSLQKTKHYKHEISYLENLT